MDEQERYSAFEGFTHIATGDLRSVVARTLEYLRNADATSALLFDNQTGRREEVDVGGTVDEIVARAQPRDARRGRGRPRLGVECGEVCLLPRQWEWLAAQPRSVSATIRRLIDAARKAETPEARVRERIDAIGAFMWAVAGDLPDFEEATRALYTRDWSRMETLITDWPSDVREHVHRMREGIDMV
jgi:uncharacterized protein